MHGPIRDRLEELLAAGSRWRGFGGDAVSERKELADCESHLEACADCSSELTDMWRQAQELKSLRLPEELEPAPGFYARVVQRIEEQTRGSIWSVFVDSPFGKRLAFASLSIALVLGTYMVRLEQRDGHLGSNKMVAETSNMHYDVPVIGSQSEQRDAVLANFAQHERVVQ